MIATAIDAGDLTDCADDTAGGLIADIDAGDFTYCADIKISDNAGNSKDCADTNVLGDAVDGLMMLMG